MYDENQIIRLVPEDRSLPPAVAWFIRAIFLFVAITATVSAGFVMVHGKGTHQAVRYVCPMHPEVSRDGPGECPICNMALKEQRFGVTNEKLTPADGLSLSIAAEATELRRHDIVDTAKKRTLQRDVRDARYPAWVDEAQTIVALLYGDVAATLTPDEPAIFVSTTNPEVEIATSYIAGAIQRWDNATYEVRFKPNLRSAPQRLKLGVAGWMRLRPRPREVLVVPQTAVLQSPTGPYVLASDDDGLTFAKRDIELAETYQGLCLSVVLSGVKERERIVARNTFFVEAERRLQRTAAQQGRL